MSYSKLGDQFTAEAKINVPARYLISLWWNKWFQVHMENKCSKKSQEKKY